jgi:hypothetical protein
MQPVADHGNDWVPIVHERARNHPIRGPTKPRTALKSSCLRPPMGWGLGDLDSAKCGAVDYFE